MRRIFAVSESQRKKQISHRMMILHGVLTVLLLVIVSRLIELQLLRGGEFRDLAHAQHFGGVTLKARRGEILSRNDRTGETSILATNTTLDMVYVDPLIVDNPTLIAEKFADILLTEEFHEACRKGLSSCPRQLADIYEIAFDPMERIKHLQTGALLEPIPFEDLPIDESALPDLVEARRIFARDIESRISEKRVTFSPVMYGANKAQIQDVQLLGISGLYASNENKLVYVNPEEIDQLRVSSYARRIADTLDLDPANVLRLLRSRPLRYVPIMDKLPPSLSAELRDLLAQSEKETQQRRAAAPDRDSRARVQDPFRCVAIVPEQWRYYPDKTVGSHVLGFLNNTGDAQYGIERTFNPQLHGKEGKILAVSDPTGGQIVTDDQRIEDAEDGDTIILTIDRIIQKEVERIMNEALKEYDADSGQAIVIEPQTGRIVSMVNVPLFDANDYGGVYQKTPITIDEQKRKGIVVELYHPDTKLFVIKSYIDDLFTAEGRKILSEEKQLEIAEIEELYNLKDIVRYYLYLGENNRHEVFPTDNPQVWLKYANNLGVGAYLNRNIQGIYEPGSVMKAITMAIALDQGEITPSETYQDDEPVKVDEFTIRNALNTYYGEVTMTNCLEYSVNTCMTYVSSKLGRKLFHRMIERFGFGRITGVELEDELPGEVQPWKKWSSALLATSSFGQGLSATPLQVATAIAALANEGKLMRPTIIDSVIKSDGTIEKNKPHMVDQVIRKETSETITAMLVSAVNNGFARTAKVPGYKIAGKTGTSQIAGPGGKYETGTGSTTTTFAGYAPPQDTKFVILVKFDRPRKIEYGSESAAPIFKQIAAFLFRYYGIPPDDV